MTTRKITTPEWECEKKGKFILCESRRGMGANLQPNGKVRVSKFDCDNPLKIEGKVIKINGDEICGGDVY